MYLDAAYIAKLYLNEPDSEAVRVLARGSEQIQTSALSIAEVNCAFLREMRQGRLSRMEGLESAALFEGHIDQGIFQMAPVSKELLKRTRLITLNAEGIFLRAGDAIHLLTAQDLGKRTVWTGDRHMLAAAPYFGLVGRSV